jgi:putative xylitol transport system substrate-binding protein
VLLREIIGEDYEPMGQLWTQYEELDWADGQEDVYNVPWTFITTENVEALLEEREALTRR